MLVCEPPIQSGPKRGQSALGTWAGYQRHRRAGEQPCGECVAGYKSDPATGNSFYAGFYEPRPKVERVCETCGGTYQSTKHPLYRYCSAECRPSTRNTVPDSVRALVLDRDDGICHICGQETDPTDIRFLNDGLTPVVGPRYPTMDHLVPRSVGGSDDPTNLAVACHHCNSVRGVAPGEQLAWAV